jgi:hypothetical protein
VLPAVLFVRQTVVPRRDGRDHRCGDGVVARYTDEVDEELVAG